MISRERTLQRPLSTRSQSRRKTTLDSDVMVNPCRLSLPYCAMLRFSKENRADAFHVNRCRVRVKLEPAKMDDTALQDSGKSSAGEVRVLSRGLAILRAFTTHNTETPRGPWLSNQEIAEEVGLPRPTVSRLTANLTSAGYLEYSHTTAQYRLASAVLTLGYAAFLALDVFTVARPILRSFAESVDALVILATRDGSQMVCHEVHHGPNLVTLKLQSGSRVPLAWSSIGHAWVGSVSASQRQKALSELQALYPESETQLEKLVGDALLQIETDGFCVSIDPQGEGVNSASVALNFPRDSSTYVVGCAGPANRFSANRLHTEIGPQLIAVKRRIEMQLDASTG